MRLFRWLARCLSRNRPETDSLNTGNVSGVRVTPSVPTRGRTSLSESRLSSHSESTMTISKGKTYKTGNGLEVRIYANDCGGSFPIHGAVKGAGGLWSATAWNADGINTSYGIWNLSEVKPKVKVERFANIYVRDGKPQILVHRKKKTADKHANKDRIACVKIDLDVEHGTGL